jgi:hypothetical protein
VIRILMGMMRRVIRMNWMIMVVMIIAMLIMISMVMLMYPRYRNGNHNGNDVVTRRQPSGTSPHDNGQLAHRSAH